MRRPGGRGEGWATDGTRTRDNLNHNQGLYQLSYGHRLRGGKLRAPRRRFKGKDAVEWPGKRWKWLCQRNILYPLLRIT